MIFSGARRLGLFSCGHLTLRGAGGRQRALGAEVDDDGRRGPRLLLGALAVLVAACWLAPAAVLVLPATAAAHWKGVALDVDYAGRPTLNHAVHRDLKRVQRAHLDMLHLYVQPRDLRSRRHVAYLTHYLRAVRRDGIRVLMTVWQPSTADMIAHPRRFAEASAHVAKLWEPYLAAIEVGDEPNFTVAHGVGYVGVLRATYPAIKRVAPQLPVIAGALAYASGNDLKAMYAAGLHGYFDALSVHPYTDNAPPEWMGGGDCAHSFACGLPWLHQIMVENGDGDKQLWVTELGWSTHKCPHCGGVSERERALYMRQVGAMTRSWPWIGAVIFWHLRCGHRQRTAAAEALEVGLALISKTWRPTRGFWALASTTY